MFNFGMADLLESGYEGAGWFLVGVFQLLVIVTVFGPMQRFWPVDPVTSTPTIRVDIVYTLIHRLGLFRVIIFFLFDPLVDFIFGYFRLVGIPTLNLDAAWPGVTDLPWVSFLIYLLVLDALDYVLHRAQHHFNWWWQLHSLHHAQRQMTMWSDNRNHLIDDLIKAVVVVLIAKVIGVAPSQYVLLVALTQLSESFQHANVRIWYGRWGERLWVSPRFHRLHHSIGIGHESSLKRNSPSLKDPVLGGHNFGVLLPCWDLLFGTANFEYRFDPTGVRDQVEQGVDYGQGFWDQQAKGMRRFLNLDK